MAKRNQQFDPKEKRLADLQTKIKEAQYLPEPTYSFEIGDSVEWGNHTDVVVWDIFADGKIYELDYTHTEHNYGNPIVRKHTRNFVSWLDVRPISTFKSSIVQNSDIQLHYSNRTVSGLLSMYYYFRTDMHPRYQRDYVWSLDDKVALIGSIFNNVDIGKFVYIHREYTDEFLYEVLDGKQRVNAITEFYENRFPYEGYYYNDLSRRDKHHFYDYPISYAELRNVTPEQKLRYFLILNTTGKVMDEKHLNKIRKMLGK